MKLIGGIGAMTPFGFGTAEANHASDDENGDGKKEPDTFDWAREGYSQYDEDATKTAPELGGFDHVLGYLAEGVVDGPTESPEQFQPDPIRIKWFQEGIMQRTPEEVRDDRQLCHDHYFNHWGLDLDARAMGETWLVDAGTFVPPLGGGGPKAAWAKDGVGPDEFTGRELEDGEGVTTDNMYKTFVFFPDPDGDATDAVVPDTPLKLEPKIGYSNYIKSGTEVPNNVEPANGTTNRDPERMNKIRDGGYWIFAVEDDSIPLDYIVDNVADFEGESKVGTKLGGKPTFWFNTTADGKNAEDAASKAARSPRSNRRISWIWTASARIAQSMTAFRSRLVSFGETTIFSAARTGIRW